MQDRFRYDATRALGGSSPAGRATRHIDFEKYKGEEHLEEWGPGSGAKTTRTVRAYDYEDPTP